MKTAQGIPRTGLARAKGDHLQAANDAKPPSDLRRLDERSWRYVSAADTQIQATWKRFGWAPTLRGGR